jgi:hypothetical protein
MRSVALLPLIAKRSERELPQARQNVRALT